MLPRPNLLSPSFGKCLGRWTNPAPDDAVSLLGFRRRPLGSIYRLEGRLPARSPRSGSEWESSASVLASNPERTLSGQPPRRSSWVYAKLDHLPSCVLPVSHEFPRRAGIAERKYLLIENTSEGSLETPTQRHVIGSRGVT